MTDIWLEIWAVGGSVYRRYLAGLVNMGVKEHAAFRRELWAEMD